MARTALRAPVVTARKMSLPRTGRVCAAQTVVEKGDVRDRHPSDAQLVIEPTVVP
jgi:transposase